MKNYIHKANNIILQQYVLVPLLALILALSYSDTLQSFYDLWFNNSNSLYSHGILIAGLCIWFTYKRLKESTQKLQLNFNIPAIFATLLLSLSWMVFDIANMLTGQQLVVYFLLQSLLIAVYGLKQYIKYYVSILLLLLTVPIWDHLNTTLRTISIYGVSQLLSLTDILFYVEGFYITLANGKFHVDTGCSGLNQFISGLSIAVIYTLINNIKSRFIILFILAGVVVSIISNTVRIFIIVVSGYLTDMQHYFITTDHVSLGWVVFSILILLYILSCNRLLDKYPCLLSEDNHKNQIDLIATAPAQSVSFTILLALFLISGPLLSQYIKSDTRMNSRYQLSLEDCYEEWCSTFNEFEFDISSRFIGNDDKLEKNYQFNEKIINLQAYVYTSQSQGKEAINDKNRMYDKNQWQFSRVIGKEKNVNSYKTILLNSPSGEKIFLRYWYFVNGKHESNQLKVKLQNIIAYFRGHPETIVFVLTADVGWDEDESIKLLDDFSEKLMKLH